MKKIIEGKMKNWFQKEEQKKKVDVWVDSAPKKQKKKDRK